MCYACDMCNRCGRYDRMKDQLGKRVCFVCGADASDGEANVCAECGAPLPPAFPDPEPEAPSESEG
ncbi:MAG: hypothetical protein HFJ65_05775 [Eggerthellaceae bacterium]|nr:hypothetical protein [Eggerthellaceae bacterium]